MEKDANKNTAFFQQINTYAKGSFSLYEFAYKRSSFSFLEGGGGGGIYIANVKTNKYWLI